MSIPIRVPLSSVGPSVNYPTMDYVAAGMGAGDGLVAPSPYYPITYTTHPHHYSVPTNTMDPYDYHNAYTTTRMAPRMVYNHNTAAMYIAAAPLRPTLPSFTSIADDAPSHHSLNHNNNNHTPTQHHRTVTVPHHRERAASGTRTPIYVRCPKSDTVFRRRRLCEMPEEEIWRCPYPGCDKSFSKLSRSAISQHRKLIHPPMTQKNTNQKKRSIECTADKPKEKKLKEEMNECDKAQQEMMMLANAAIYTSHQQNDDVSNHHQPTPRNRDEWDKSNHPSDESDDDQSIDTPLASIAATPILSNASLSHSYSPPIRRASAWIATNERSISEKDEESHKKIHRLRPPTNFSTYATSTNALILSQ